MKFRIWGILGLLTSTLILGAGISFAESISDDGIASQQVLDIMNNNERIISYMEAPVNKDNISKDVYVSANKVSGIEKKFTLTLTGTKKAETVVATLLKSDSNIATMDLTITDSTGVEHKFIDLFMKTNVLKKDELAKKSTVKYFSEIIDKVESEDGFLLLTRSPDTNDFMQVGTLKGETKPCLFVEYSEGFIPEKNKQIYRADGVCQSKEDVLKLLYSYVTGKDEFKKQIKWKQLKKIDGEQYIY